MAGGNRVNNINKKSVQAEKRREILFWKEGMEEKKKEHNSVLKKRIKLLN